MRFSKSKHILSAYVMKIAITVMILLLGGLVYYRLDISKGKAFSLGKYSADVAAGLRDNMVVKLYVSKDLPPEYGRINRYIKDLLSEYKRNSKGKISFEYVKYNGPSELREMAEMNGLQMRGVPIMERDQFVLKEVIMGLVFESSGKMLALDLYNYPDPTQDPLGRLGLEAKLEYEITKRIQVLGGTALPQVTVFQDSTFKYMPVRLLNQELRANYEPFFTELDSIPRQTPVMLFTGALYNLSAEQLYNLDQYIMKGGKVVILQDRLDLTSFPDLSTLSINLFALLQHYGIVIHPNMILDRNSVIGQGQGLGAQMPYPFIPVVRSVRGNSVTGDTGDIVLYFTSEVTARDSMGLQFEPMLQTSSQSGRLVEPFNLEAVVTQQSENEYLNLPPITVGGRFFGTARSYFAGSEYSQRPGFVAESKDVEVIVLGDRELSLDPENAEPQYLNRTFLVLNSIDYMLGNKSMIKIRTRSMRSSILDIRVFMMNNGIIPAEPEPVINRYRLIFKSVAIAVPTLLLGILGLMVYISRRRIVKRYETP